MARRTRSLIAVAACLAALTAACGSDAATTTAGPTTTAATGPSTSPSPSPTGSATGTGAPDLPAIDVVALASGDSVPLQSLARPGRPTLLWFWAPHCTICRREAPEVLRFTAEHGADVDVLGLGAQDTLDEAYGFLDDTDTHDLTMVWDRSGQSWIHHGVTSQPTVVVLDAQGQVAGTWFRDFDVDGILAAAGVT